MSTAYPYEGQFKGGTGPDPVALTYTNASGASMSIVNHEIGAINSGAGERTAFVLMAGDKVATIGTLANGETGTVYIAGRFLVPKSTSVAFTQGEPVYWDASLDQADNNTTANLMADFVLGQCVDAAATSGTHVLVDLNTGGSAHGIGSSSSSSESSSSSLSSESSSSSSSES
jgi:predicted RecA/RadA family phage recombinase